MWIQFESYAVQKVLAVALKNLLPSMTIGRTGLCLKHALLLINQKTLVRARAADPWTGAAVGLTTLGSVCIVLAHFLSHGM